MQFTYMKIEYNAPVTLNYTLACAIVLGLSSVLGEWFRSIFVLYGDFQPSNIVSYIRLFSYVLGHADFAHYIGNFTLILLVGPMLEEKYGSRLLLQMMIVTAFVTAVVNLMIFGDNVLGASGIVFMLIMLSSFTSFKAGKIPLTFILVFSLFIGKEIINSFAVDQVSQYGHIMGGICGALFGFYVTKRRVE